MDNIIIQSTLFPPIQQISWLMRSKNALIEQYDTYAKQTFRNRMQIAGSNGLQSMSIPIEKPFGSATRMKDIIIKYDTPWQDQFLKSIKTTYRNSPFYEYYIDDFIPFFTRETEKLVEYNTLILKKILNILEIETSISLTDSYETPYDKDFREIAHPKPQYQKPDPTFRPIVYHQLFSAKFGFIPNISIIDLIFNEGPLSYFVLKKTFVSKP